MGENKRMAWRRGSWASGRSRLNLTVVQICATCSSNPALQDSCINTRFRVLMYVVCPSKTKQIIIIIIKKSPVSVTVTVTVYIFMLMIAYTSPISDMFKSVL